MSPRNYWIGVVSRNHVERGVAGGFAQLNHGKAGPARAHAPGRRPRLLLAADRLSGRCTGAGVHRYRPRGHRDDLPGPGGRRHAVPARSEYLPAAEAPIKPMLDGSLVHPQQGALGCGIPLRVPARAGGGFRAHRQRHGPRLRARLRGAARRPTRRRRSGRAIVAAVATGSGDDDGSDGDGAVPAQAGQGRRPHGVHARPPARAARRRASRPIGRTRSCGPATARWSRSSNGFRRRRSTTRTAIAEVGKLWARYAAVLRLRHAGRPARGRAKCSRASSSSQTIYVSAHSATPSGPPRYEPCDHLARTAVPR